MASRGVAAVIIGNEVLSAKVVEQNGSVLIQRLRERGVPLRCLTIVPDEIDAIVEALTLARSRADAVITSGGIGPTHDDVTVRAVALALGRKVVRLPEMEALIRAHYKKPVPAEGMRLADAPEGAELLPQPGSWYPVLICDGIYLLPGVPQLFKSQLEVVLPRLEGAPLTLKVLFLGSGEAEIARALDEVALSMPEVAIGSYPTFDPQAGYRVKVTVEHSRGAAVEAALARLLGALPPGSVLRIE